MGGSDRPILLGSHLKREHRARGGRLQGWTREEASKEME